MAKASSRARHELRVLKGADAGASLPLRESRLSLGRAPTCDAVLHDETIAEEHLQTVFAEGVLTLLSNKSEEGGTPHPVWVNGARLEDFPHDVRAGDVVQLGQTIFAIGAKDGDWPADDSLKLMALPQDKETLAARRAQRKWRFGLWGGIGLGGLAVAIMAAALLRQGSLARHTPTLELDRARTQLDFALRTDAAFMHVHAHTEDGAVMLGGLVGKEEDFQRLRTLADMAQFGFAVENGAMVAQKLRAALSPQLPYVRARAQLKNEGHLHIALEGRVPVLAEAKMLARETAQSLAKAEQWPDITLSFMLEDYQEFLLQLQDALDEEPALDGVALEQAGDKFRVHGALLASYAPQLQEILSRLLGEDEVAALVQQEQVLVPPPAGRLLGWVAAPLRLRYQDASDNVQEAAIGELIEDSWRVLRIQPVGAWLQYGEHEVLWPNPQAPRREINLDVLAQSLEAALEADPIFGELELTRKPTRLILHGGLAGSGDARLQAILAQLTGGVRARHRLLLRITEVPDPDGEVVTIFDGATKAVRMRRDAGQERLVKIGELLGNGLKLTDIVDGTVQVQFGDVYARLQVGGAGP